MKLVKASCPCGFVTNKVRWGYHYFQWWFPMFDIKTGRLIEESFVLPEDEQRQLMTRGTRAEIGARCAEVEREIIEQLRARRSPDVLLFIDQQDTDETPLLCTRCHKKTLRLLHVIVWANCRTDCGNRYPWTDSEEQGCPTCSHRPHSFEIEGEGEISERCVCYCRCSSRTVCRSYEDGYCPKCGSLPSSYELNGIASCGLHHRQMIPYRLPSGFLFMEPGCRSASHRFPHARIWGEAAPNTDAIEGGYCESCDAMRNEWLAQHNVT